MEILIRRADLATRSADVLAVGVPEGAPARGGFAARFDAASRGALKALRASGDFAGHAGDTAVLYPAGLKAKRVLLVGLGGLGPAGELDEQCVLLATAAAARRARDLGAETLALAISERVETSPALLRAAGEGVLLG